MTRILGIDPGSRITGYGLIGTEGGRFFYIDAGHIRTSSQQSLSERLKAIFEGVRELIINQKPDEMAIERVFMHRNADSALKLGQARGVAICAGAVSDLTISEYAPRAIKQSIVGKGAADKIQVQHMICVLLRLSERPQADAADALAVALCHAHTMQTANRWQSALLGKRR